MRIGLWWVDTYTLRILVAGAVALAWLGWWSRRHAGHRLSTESLGWGIAGVTAVALFAGRAGFILLNLDYFRQHPGAVLRLKQVAGIDDIGAMIGALAALGVWAARQGQGLTFYSLLSQLAPAGLWTAAGMWWARQGIGEAWGRVASSEGSWTWLATQSPDLYHTVALRYAVQTLGMGWAALMALLAWLWGPNGVLAIALYLAGAAALTLLRGDQVPLLWGIRVDTVLYAGLALALTAYSGVALSRRTGIHTGLAGPEPR